MFTVSNRLGASADSSLNATRDMPRPQRVWIFYIAATVVLLSAVHALLGAYDPEALTWIDPKFAGIMAALRYVGLDCARPGLTGPLSPQFYINQVGFSAWGVIFSTIATLVQVFRGTLTVADPDASVRKLMNAKGYSARKGRVATARKNPVVDTTHNHSAGGVVSQRRVRLVAVPCSGPGLDHPAYLLRGDNLFLSCSRAHPHCGAIWLRRDIRKIIAIAGLSVKE